MSVFALCLIICMLVVIALDITRYTIPNWLNFLLLVLYPLAVYLSPHAIDWKMALAAMGIVFVIGYVVFALHWMGGGDIKLLTVCSLWAGLSHLLDFILLVGVLGGLFSVALWLIRKFEPYYGKDRSVPRILKNGEPVPYGVAIAIAMLWLLFMGEVPAAIP